MKRSLLAMALAASMATAAVASEKQTPEFANNAFNQADVQALFGQDEQKTLQPIALSAQEMQDTEGALIGIGVDVEIGRGHYRPRHPRYYRGPWYGCRGYRC